VADAPRAPIRSNDPRLLVHDFAQSGAFYRETLGLGAAFGDAAPPYGEVGDAEHMVGVLSRSAIDGVLGAGDARAAAPDRFVLVFAVDDVDAAYARLSVRGVPMLTTPTDRPLWGPRTVHLRDPDGNLVELYSRRPPSNRAPAL
jgi:catechol 2,3-dioxygenase-like lactoylglutathione lyase family enzyme